MEPDQGLLKIDNTKTLRAMLSEPSTQTVDASTISRALHNTISKAYSGQNDDPLQDGQTVIGLQTNSVVFNSACQAISENNLPPVPIEARLDRFIKSNEDILQNHNTWSLRPKCKQDNISTSPYSVQGTTSKGTSKVKPVRAGEINLRTLPKCSIIPSAADSDGLGDFSFYQLEQAVARPMCPTISCSIENSDRSLFASPLVQWTAKSVDIGPSNEHIKDIICGVSTPAEVRLQGRDTLQLDNSFYWCNFCPFKAVTKEDFVSHVAIHRFSCKFCRFQAFSRAEVVRHTCVQHPNSSEAPWQFCSFFHDSLKIKQDKTKQNTEDLKSRNCELLNMHVVNKEENVQIFSNKPSFTASKAESKSDNQPIAVQESSVDKPTLESSDATGHSWTCGYCDFVTLNYSLVKVHCSIMHPSLTVLAKVSTVTEAMASQIKKLDSVRQLHFDKGKKEFLQSSDSVRTSQKVAQAHSNEVTVSQSPTLSHSNLSVKDFEQSSISKEISNKSKELKEIETINSFECYHCQGQTLRTNGLKTHLETYHKGEPYIAIDLKAVRLKQARHIVFCGISECDFYCRASDQYFEHYETCHPDMKTSGEITAKVSQSIERTLEFTKKMRTKARGIKKRAFSCRYCDFKCKLSEMIRSHVTTCHKDLRSCYNVEIPSSKGTQKSKTFYFCTICKSFENRKLLEFSQHVLSHSSERMGDEDYEITEQPTVYMDVDVSDTKPSNQELERMLDEYLEEETKTKIATLGSAARPAAVKAQLKLKTADQVPCYYHCRHCQHQCYGSNLMKAHIATHHKHLSLVAQDMKKKANHHQSLMSLCPSPGCSFVAAVSEDTEMKEHCLEVHEKDYDVLEEQLLSKYESESPKSKSQKGSYLCLYCSDKVVMETTLLMRDHVISKHPGEEVIMRDLVARKNKVKQCRIYMCDEDNCYFITSNNDLHKIHIRAHEDERMVTTEQGDLDDDMLNNVKVESVELESEDTSSRSPPLKRIKTEPVDSYFE